jgi:cystathionine beta-synthase
VVDRHELEATLCWRSIAREGAILMKIYANVLATVGRTPLIRLNRLTGGSRGSVVVKYEAFNPGGSVKDRIAVHMLEDAERRGLLRPGGTVIECTSGNTGLGLAIAAAVKGYRAIFTMPDKVSSEKANLLRAYGAEVILAPTAVEPTDPRSYYSIAKRLSEEIPDSYYPNQYQNPMNPDAHYRSTGPEIWEDTDGRVTHFVAGMGTGGTISGTARYLKERNPWIRVIGVDPVGSLYYDYVKTGQLGVAHTYLIEGVGEDIIPGTIDFNLIDDVVQVGDRDGFRTARRLAREEGIFSGSSAGMTMFGALQLAPTLGPDDLMVVLIPDTGERYLSKVYNDEWLRKNQLLEWTAPLSLGEILARKRREAVRLITVPDEATVLEAIEVMRDRDVSQVPVVRGDRFVGSIRESTVIQLLLDGGEATAQAVRRVMDPPFPVVDESSSSTDVFTQLCKGHPAVLVAGTQGDHHIVTKWDLIQSVSRA